MSKASYLLNMLFILLGGYFIQTALVPLFAAQVAGTPAGWVFVIIATAVLWFIVIALIYRIQWEARSRYKAKLKSKGKI